MLIIKRLVKILGFLFCRKVIKPLSFLMYPKIDVVVPVHIKDLSLLTFVLEGLRNNSMNPIGKVFVVGCDEVRKKLVNTNVVFVHENSLGLPAKSELGYITNTGHDRNGWLFQQLIKLHADEISESNFILIIDADTIFVRPMVFVNPLGQTLLLYSDEYHKPYGESMKKLLPNRKRFEKSFVSHQIVIPRKVFEELRSEIVLNKLGSKERNSNFVDCLLAVVDKNEGASISEYELLGNFYYSIYFKNIRLAHWANKSVIVKSNTQSEFIKSVQMSLVGLKYSRYKSCSFHSYNRM
jgi:hypothetical protein